MPYLLELFRHCNAKKQPSTADSLRNGHRGADRFWLNEIGARCFQMGITDSSSPKALAADGIVPILFHAADNGNESTTADGLVESLQSVSLVIPADPGSGSGAGAGIQ